MSVLNFNPNNTDWNLIRSFNAVIEHGSLTRAAIALELSQATLSRQIAELEKTSARHSSSALHVACN